MSTISLILFIIAGAFTIVQLAQHATVIAGRAVQSNPTGFWIALGTAIAGVLLR